MTVPGGRDGRATPAPGGIVTAVTFAADGEALLVLDRASAGVLSMATGKRLAQFSEPDPGDQRPLEVRASPDGRTRAAVYPDGILRLWDARTGAVRAASPQTIAGSLLAYSPDGRTIVTGGRKGVVGLWDAATARLRRTLHGGPADVYRMALSPDGSLMATATQPDPDAGRSANMFTPYGHLLRTGTPHLVQVWELPDGHHRTTLSVGEDPVGTLALSPNGTMLAASTAVIYPGVGAKGHVSLWDLASGERRAVWPLACAWRLGFSPDDSMLAAAGSTGGTAHVWDTESGKTLAVLGGHRQYDVDALAFSADGRTLATLSAYEPRLWDLPSGTLRAVLPQSLHSDFRLACLEDPVCLAFSRDEQLLGTVDRFGETRVWDVSAGQRVQLARWEDWETFPATIAHPVARSEPGPVDPRRGDELASFRLVPDWVPGQPPGVKPPRPDAGHIIFTPAGYIDFSGDVLPFLTWAGPQSASLPGERYVRRTHRPALIRRILRGEPVPAAMIPADEAPPVARLVGLRDGNSVNTRTLAVTVEAGGPHSASDVTVRLDGRICHARLTRRAPVRVPRGTDRAGRSWPGQRFVLMVTIPPGRDQIQLSVTAYDSTGLGSDPADVVLKRQAFASTKAGAARRDGRRGSL